METFDEFCAKEHQRRVNHFIRFIQAHARAATIEDFIEIFGFCERDARPIFNDATAATAQSGFIGAV